MSLRVHATVRRGAFALEATFAAQTGETVVVVGPNGAGKSTLLSLLAGLDRPTSGAITFDGRALDDTATGDHVRPGDRDAGVLFQDLRLFPHLTVIENVAFPLRARGVRAPRARGRARDTLHRVGVADRADALPATLSGGEAVKVALARALVAEPRLLLLDEPFAAIDPGARAELRSLFRRILRAFDGVAVLVSHDPTDVMTLGDRVVVLEGGRVTRAATPGEVLEDPRSAWAAEFVGLNLFRGRLLPLETGAGRLAVEGGGELVVAWPSGRAQTPLDEVSIVVRPADVTLSRGAPTTGSARNMLRGPIDAITAGPDRARVRIQSRPPVVAEVTLGTVERMALALGDELWASFKAVEPRVLLEGGPDGGEGAALSSPAMSDITYDRATALIVVDVQNDFADPKGNLSVAGGAEVVPLINAEAQRARAAGGFVIYTADWHPEHTPHFAKDGGIWPDHCIGDTWGAGFHPDLVVDGPVVKKGVDGQDGYSGFSVRDPESGDVTKTELGRLLRERGIEKLVVCGLATDYCVKATALDGIEEGFSVTLWKAASRSVDLQPGDGDAALAEVAAAGGTLV